MKEGLTAGAVIGVISTYFLNKKFIISRMTKELDKTRASVLKMANAFKKIYGEELDINKSIAVNEDIDKSIVSFYIKARDGKLNEDDVKKYWCTLHNTVYQLKYNLEDLSKCILPAKM